jgi:hypothetical protein
LLNIGSRDTAHSQVIRESPRYFANCSLTLPHLDSNEEEADIFSSGDRWLTVI